MKIIDLSDEHRDLFCLCLADWSEEAKEAGPGRRQLLERCQPQGLRARLALDDDGVAEWGASDAVLVDGKNVQKGPPPSYEKIRRSIARRIARL